MTLWRMAFRNILRSRRRSLITGLAMAFALAVMMAYGGLIDGLLTGMKKNALELEIGHFQIHEDDYRNSPSLYKRIPEATELVKKIEGLGYRASLRLFASGLAAHENSSAGVFLRGVDPEREAEATQLPRHLREGEWLSSAKPKNIVLGKRLAKSLAVTVGDEIVLVSQAADGSTANDLFNVGGILKTIGDATDRSALFMSAATFREFMVMPEGAHEIAVTLADESKMGEAQPRIAALLGPDLELLSWKQVNPSLAEMFVAMDISLIPTIGLVYIAIAIVILNAMLMAVFERIREYGVMKAIGVGPGAIFKLVLGEMAILSTASAVLGVGLGIPLLVYFERHGISLEGIAGDTSFSGIAMEPVWYAIATPRAVLAPLIILFVMSVLATLYPALKAARLDPIQAIHHR
jgi:ABC-type lipoprotein release transport system permease subunit